MPATHYHKDTSEEVKKVLESLLHTDRRVRVWYGDTETGQAWPEENDVTGTISRSCGTEPIVILVNNARLLGGGGLLDSAIIRIVEIATKRVLYSHPKFYAGQWTIDAERWASNGKAFTRVTLRDAANHDQVYANCRSRKEATRLVDFMTGARFSH